MKNAGGMRGGKRQGDQCSFLKSKCVSSETCRREGRAQPQGIIYLLRWQTLHYQETTPAVAVIKNPFATCHYWQITSLENPADWLKVALPQKVDTWNTTLMTA